MKQAEVQILLSTYNGAQFLREQLDSLLAQTFQHWELLVKDDGSEDNTLKIIEEYRASHSNKIRLIKEGEGGNASLSFMSMLKHATASYLMFCDQDDVWLPDKVDGAVTAIKKAETENKLALYFTDMKVVDADLNELHASFFQQQKLKPEWTTEPYFAFAQSIAAGCTMIFTQALAQKLHPIKAPLFQHDHWLLMHAAYYGKVSYSKEKTVLYRQHHANVVGSHNINRSYFLAKRNSLTAIYSRWKYIKDQFGEQISIPKIMWAKFRLNLSRV